MATVILFDDFGKHLGDGSHILGTHTYRLILTNHAPVQTTDSLYGDVSPDALGTAGGYTAGGEIITMVWAETSAGSGIWRFGDTNSSTTFTATAAGIGPFQWGILYNDSQTSPSKPLVGYIAAPSAVTLAENDTYTFDAGTDGWFQLTIPNPA